MEFVKNIFNKGLFDVSLFEENIHFFVYSAICFFIPFFLAHPQLLTGTLVNSSLFLTSFYVKKAKIIPVVMLPSIAVLSRGVIFGPYTVFLLYMIPFIWIGNAILVYVNRAVYLKTKKSLISMLFASLLKAGFLFSIAYALVSISVLPRVFLSSMGLMQVLTAVSGGVLALAIVFFKNRFFSSSKQKDVV